MVAGTISNVLPDSSEYHLLGEFDDADQIYAVADVVISPILFGTGLKIKNVEALAYAKPLVTTPVGAEGLEGGAHSAFRVGTDSKEFAQHVIELLTNYDLRRHMSQNAYTFVRKLHQQHVETLRRLLA